MCFSRTNIKNPLFSIERNFPKCIFSCLCLFDVGWTGQPWQYICRYADSTCTVITIINKYNITGVDSEILCRDRTSKYYARKFTLEILMHANRRFVSKEMQKKKKKKLKKSLDIRGVQVIISTSVAFLLCKQRCNLRID